VDSDTRPILLDAFVLALRDAMQHRERNAEGDYSPDPKAQRFPEWKSPQAATAGRAKAASSNAKSSLKALVEDWWREAKAAGRKPSTHESYRNSMAALVAFLRHDDALRVTPEDILRFKDHRLATINPRSGRHIAAKTVKDSDLASLKTIFGWAVSNRRMPTNPATGITIKLGKQAKLRSKGFTDDEANAILTVATNLQRTGEQPWTFAAKRWVPWLCAYTGARVGELAQLRKQDVAQEGEHWVIRVTPEAGTVKTNEARKIVLHPHIIEQGFAAFVATAPAGHLFLKVGREGDVLGPLQGLKNRLATFARAIVTDPNVAPNHGWRHRFKTVGMEAGIAPRILDAIQGQAARSVADTYGDVTVNTMAAAIGKLPRIVT
jgi:integrase